MRTIVMGGTGMLGSAVRVEWRRRGWPVLALSRFQGDVTDRDRMTHWVEAFHPELVINCAAFTGVDACEGEEDLAAEVNGRAVANVAAAAGRVRAKLVQVSTDYVFDGCSAEAYPEEAAPAPLSIYGKSKRLGEEEALAYPLSLVVRTSWLFGPGGANFVATIRRLVSERKTPLRVVDDQVGCPTYTPYLARALRRLVERDARGIVHYRNRSAVSWHGFATEIVRAIDPETEVAPVTTDEVPRPAPRPRYSVLDVSRAEAILGRRVEPWSHGLARYLDL